MPITRIAEPAVEPISVAEFKAWAKIDHDDEDAIIDALIHAARRACEEEIRRTLIDTKWRATFDAFPDSLQLRMPRIRSVEAVRFIDTEGQTQTLDPQDYKLDSEREPGWLLPAYGKAWPETRCEVNAVQVEYTAGYGPSAASVPHDLRLWLRLQVGHFFKNREATTTPIQRTPYFEGLLDPYRVVEQ